jgi:hypothetical protein
VLGGRQKKKKKKKKKKLKKPVHVLKKGGAGVTAFTDPLGGKGVHWSCWRVERKRQSEVRLSYNRPQIWHTLAQKW